MPSMLTKIERDKALSEALAPNSVVERLCRITLSKSAPRPIELRWLRDRFSKETLILLKPGQTVEQPLNKCHSWFGPFYRYAEYESAIKKGEEKVAAVLRDHIATETARYLNRYDYPRGNGRGSQPDMQPVGPHRSPDVTIQVLDPEGHHDAPIRLHEVYGVGDFDDLKDTFHKPETEAEIKARYESKLKSQATEFLERDRERETQLASLVGQVTALVAVGAVAKKTEATA
jgi:hypothetical protein